MLVDIIQTWSITSRTRNVTRLSICYIYHVTNTRQVWRILFEIRDYLSRTRVTIEKFVKYLFSDSFVFTFRFIIKNNLKNVKTMYICKWKENHNLLCKSILKVRIKYC